MSFGLVDKFLLPNRQLRDPNNIMFGISDNLRWPVYGFSDARDAMHFKLKFHI